MFPCNISTVSVGNVSVFTWVCMNALFLSLSLAHAPRPALPAVRARAQINATAPSLSAHSTLLRLHWLLLSWRIFMRNLTVFLPVFRLSRAMFPSYPSTVLSLSSAATASSSTALSTSSTAVSSSASCLNYRRKPAYGTLPPPTGLGYDTGN